jgi:PKD repeat protein
MLLLGGPIILYKNTSIFTFKQNKICHNFFCACLGAFSPRPSPSLKYSRTGRKNYTFQITTPTHFFSFSNFNFMLLSTIARCLATFFLAFLGDTVAFSSTFEVEPNNNEASSQVILLGAEYSGQVTTMQDKDYFAIPNLPQGAYTLSIKYPLNAPHRDWWTILESTTGLEPSHECYYPSAGIHLVVFKNCKTQTVYFRGVPNTDFGLTNHQYTIKVSSDDVEDPDECTDLSTDARTVEMPSVLIGKIAIKGDKEWFKIKHISSGQFSINATTPFGEAMELSLYNSTDPNATPIATGTNVLNTIIPQGAGGTYYLLANYPVDVSANKPYSLQLNYVLVTPPSALFSFTKNSLTVKFTPQAQDPTFTYSWDVGNGFFSSDMIPVHTYTSNGVYNVKLTVTNSIGESATYQQTLSIQTITIRYGIAEGKQGDTVLVTVRAFGFPDRLTGIQGVNYVDTSVCKVIGFKSGKLDVSNIINNPANNAFILTLNGNGVPVADGDTLMSIRVVLNGNPGDTSLIRLESGTTLGVQIVGIVGNTAQILDVTVIPGVVKIRNFFKVSGHVLRPNGLPIPNTAVVLSIGTTEIKTTVTDAQGGYTLDSVPFANAPYILTVAKNDSSVINGLSAYTIYLATRWLVGLDNSYIVAPWQAQIIDVNCDNTVSVQDLVLQQRFVVGLETAFPCDYDWLLWRSDFTWPSTIAPIPLSQIAQDTIFSNNLGDSVVVINFIGARITDFTLVDEPDQITPAETEVRGSEIYEMGRLGKLKTGEIIERTVYAANDMELAAAQMHFKANDPAIEILDISPVDIGLLQIFSTNIQKNNAKLSFVNTGKSSILKGTPLFTVKMRIQNDLNSETLPLSIAQEPMNTLAPIQYDPSGNKSQINLIEREEVETAHTRVIGTLTPNPATEEGTSLLIEGNGLAICTIYNTLGEMVSNQNLEINGLQRVAVPTAQLASGIYHITLLADGLNYQSTLVVVRK